VGYLKLLQQLRTGNSNLNFLYAVVAIISNSPQMMKI
jgi:hypothetical protein